MSARWFIISTMLPFGWCAGNERPGYYQYMEITKKKPRGRCQDWKICKIHIVFRFVPLLFCSYWFLNTKQVVWEANGLFHLAGKNFTLHWSFLLSGSGSGFGFVFKLCEKPWRAQRMKTFWYLVLLEASWKIYDFDFYR